jgi:hypothetical protein
MLRPPVTVTSCLIPSASLLFKAVVRTAGQKERRARLAAPGSRKPSRLPRAVRLGSQTIAILKDADTVDTLACAYAQAGEFESAKEVERKAASPATLRCFRPASANLQRFRFWETTLSRSGRASGNRQRTHAVPLGVAMPSVRASPRLTVVVAFSKRAWIPRWRMSADRRLPCQFWHTMCQIAGGIHGSRRLGA